MTSAENGPEDRNSTEGTIRLLETVGALVAEMRPGNTRSAPAALDSTFDRDLGLDSLSRVELIARVETEFGVALPEAVLGNAETPRDLLRALQAADKRERRTPSAATAPKSPEPRLATVGALPHQAETLIEVIVWHAEAHPDRPHLRLYDDEGDGEVLTYGQLRDGAAEVAAGLLARGLSPQEPVILMLPTGLDYFLSFAGVLMAGGIPVPIYPPARMTQIEEHLNRHVGIARNAGAAAMITFEKARRLGGLLKTRAETIRDVVTPADLRKDGAASPPPSLPAAAAGDTAFLQYTSGSTGAPKGVTLSHANLLANVRAMGQALEAGPEDVIVSWLPLYHDMGLIGAWLGSLYYAAHFVVMPPLAFLGRPVRWLRAIHRYRGTISAAPNFAYEMCLRRISDEDLEGLDLSSWRIAANGAEPISPDSLRGFCERFEPHGFARTTMMPMFGLAENCVGLAFPPLDRGPLIDRVKRRALSDRGVAEAAGEGDDEAGVIEFVACGRPIPGHEIRIADNDGRELPERREGRLQFKGPSATSGYWRNPEATREMFRDGWLDSGDRAYIAGGDVHVTGRSKDIVIRAGRNIYPAEIEDAVGELDGVLKGNVAVFGVPGADSGTERLVVLAETRRRDASAQDTVRTAINGLVSDLLGSPADEVVLAPPNTVPKTSSGKIRRAASRDIHLKGLIGKPRAAVWRQVVRAALAGLGPLVRRTARRAADWAFAAWFWTVLAMLTGPIVWLSVAILPGARLRWAAARIGARLFLRLTGALPRLAGAENLPPPEEPVLMVSNHMSYLDGCVLVAALPRPVSFVAKGELEGQFVAGMFLKRLGAVFVERFDARKGAEDAKRIAEMAGDRPMLYFPEGTFTRAPGLLPFRMGAFATAAGAGLPVVPLVIRGTRNILRSDSWFPRRGRVRVTVIDPIPAGDETSNVWKTALALRAETRRRILRHTGEPDLETETSPLLTAEPEG